MPFNDFSTNGLLSQIRDLLSGQGEAGVSETNPVDAAGDPITQLGGIRVTGPALVARMASSAATTNAALCKGSTARLFKVTGSNIAAATRYLKLYNKATAPIPGTDFPFWVEALEASSSFEITFPAGLYFSLGLGYALTVNAADMDATAIEAGDIVSMNVAYL